MERLYSNIIGTPVRDDGVRPLTTVKDVLIDPENGKLLALIVNVNKNLVVVPMDIISWHDSIHIHHHDNIVEANEVLRVAEVMGSGIHIFGNKVETKGGKLLGKVFDFSIGSEDLVLKKIYVAKEFLGLVRFESRIIPSRNIIEILPNKIVVENDLQTVKEENAKSNVAFDDVAAG